MNYIYDILLNYKKDLQDFYEWNNEDQIEHIRKIPLFKVSTQAILKIRDNAVKIPDEMKNKLSQKTEIFFNKKISTIPYACLISDGEISIALKFNDCGITIAKSRLLIDEEEEVIDMCEQLEIDKFEFAPLKPSKQVDFMTVYECEQKEFTLKEIEKMVKTNDHEKIKYLYYECYNAREEDMQEAVKKIKLSVDEDWDNIHQSLLNFIKLTSTSY